MNPLQHPVDPRVISATFNEQLAVGAGMIALCVVIHGVGLFTLGRLMRGRRAEERLARIEPLSVHGALVTLFVVFALVIVHFVEIWLFALLYDLVGALRTFQDALYFSTISYATLGSNEPISHTWRLVGAIEGLIGIILLGWSTAFFVRVLAHLEREPKR